MSLSSGLILGACTIFFGLGTLHLYFTFSGAKLKPRDPALWQAMREGHPGISRQTTMWDAWVGFNASHSLGAMAFAASYSYLALFQPGVLFDSVFLGSVGLAMMASFVALAWRYWFSIPLRGCLLALGLYVAGFALAGQ